MIDVNKDWTPKKKFNRLHRELRVLGPSGGINRCLPWNVRHYFAAWAAVKWIWRDRDSIGNPIRHELNIWRNEHGRQ